MKQQVFVIHGGNTFDSYEEYIEHLKQKNVSLEDLKYVDWKQSLQKTLGENYDVLLPRMPSGNNAKYLEWKIYFEKFIPLLDDNVIFIGHSLGGIFLAKYLSEEKYPHKIKAVFLVAAPYDTAHQHLLSDFVISENLENFQNQVVHIFLYHSTDDLVVPFADFERYAESLPFAQKRILTERNHINQEKFPELITDIQSLM